MNVKLERVKILLFFSVSLVQNLNNLQWLTKNTDNCRAEGGGAVYHFSPSTTPSLWSHISMTIIPGNINVMSHNKFKCVCKQLEIYFPMFLAPPYPSNFREQT